MFKESIYRGVYVTEVSLLQMSMLQRFSYYRGVHITRESIQVSMSEKCSCYRGTGYPSVTRLSFTKRDSINYISYGLHH